MQIRTDPNTFYEFLSALKEDPSMKSLVESVESKCFVCCHIITWVPPNLECSRNCFSLLPERKKESSHETNMA